MSKRLTIDEAKQALSIDPDDLDECLMRQPDLFYHVADECALAVADRDLAKLDLDEKMAELDESVRKDAARREEKITESAIMARLRGLPAVKTLTRTYLATRADAERWLALKEGFQQRSFMLREMVARQIAQLNHLALERGSASSRARLGDATRDHIAEARRATGNNRYRSRDD